MKNKEPSQNDLPWQRANLQNFAFSFGHISEKSHPALLFLSSLGIKKGKAARFAQKKGKT